MRAKIEIKGITPFQTRIFYQEIKAYIRQKASKEKVEVLILQAK